MTRSLRPSYLIATILTLAGLALGQSAPQLARDYIYGPGGRLAVTIEPDYYPPETPSCDAFPSGDCPNYTIDVSWGATDIGSGIAGYYGPGGYTTQTGYSDTGVFPGQCYTYYVSAVDNAGNESDVAASNEVCLEPCEEGAFDRFSLENRTWAAMAVVSEGRVVSPVDGGPFRLSIRRRTRFPIEKLFGADLLPRSARARNSWQVRASAKGILTSARAPDPLVWFSPRPPKVPGLFDTKPQLLPLALRARTRRGGK